jgi:hypothetical protein
MRTTIGFLLLLAVFSCSGTKTSFKSEAEFQEYLNDPDNGYISSDENGDFLLEAKLVPAIASDKAPQYTVQLRLSRKDGGSVLDFGGVQQSEALEREGYLSFEVLGDVYLEDGENLQPAIFHHYERNYGLKPSVDLFFRFSHFTPKDDVTLVYRDQLFNQGMFRISFNKALFTSCHVQ